MTKKSMEIHHITAIVGNPQENVDIYAGVLGLRLVKQTVNFDDPDGLHIELVERKEDPPNPWNFGGISSEHAIKGFGILCTTT